MLLNFDCLFMYYMYTHIFLHTNTEHGYAKIANENTEMEGTSNDSSLDVGRKSQRVRKQTDRLCLSSDIRCVVCKQRLSNIGISLSDVVCSKSCL